MLLAIFVILIVVPIIELFVIVQMAHLIGILPTLLVLVVLSIGGAWLVKREGLGAIRRVQGQLNSGEIPAEGLLDGVLIMFAGAMLLFPGFVTDSFGLLLLLAPVRALVRKIVAGRLLARFDRPGAGRVYDVSTVQYVRSTYDPNPNRVPEADIPGGRELGPG